MTVIAAGFERWEAQPPARSATATARVDRARRGPQPGARRRLGPRGHLRHPGRRRPRPGRRRLRRALVPALTRPWRRPAGAGTGRPSRSVHAAWSDASRGDLRPAGHGRRDGWAARPPCRRMAGASGGAGRPRWCGSPRSTAPGRGVVGARGPPGATPRTTGPRRCAPSVSHLGEADALVATDARHRPVRPDGRLRPAGTRQPRRGVRRRPRRLAWPGGRCDRGRGRAAMRELGATDVRGRARARASTPSATSSATDELDAVAAALRRRGAGRGPSGGRPGTRPDRPASASALASAGAGRRRRRRRLHGVRRPATSPTGPAAIRGRQALLVWAGRTGPVIVTSASGPVPGFDERLAALRARIEAALLPIPAGSR